MEALVRTGPIATIVASMIVVFAVNLALEVSRATFMATENETGGASSAHLLPIVDFVEPYTEAVGLPLF